MASLPAQPFHLARNAWQSRPGFTWKIEVPAHLRDRLRMVQSERLHQLLPLMCIVVALNSLLMAFAILGDLPVWQQAAPPVIIVTTCLAVLIVSRVTRRPATPDEAERSISRAPWIAGGLGLVAGAWCVNAFTETEQYYCMTAPVFSGIAAIVSATCLLSVPRAAIAAMACTLAPIIVKLFTYDYDSLRAMAVMLTLLVVMQSGVVIAKFRETIAALDMEDRLGRLADTDMLTGLANRRAFDNTLEAALEGDSEVVLVIGDLDGFKPVNDEHGHQAGDAVLADTARRLRTLAPEADCIARLGGDEFALLFTGRSLDSIEAKLEAYAATVALPHSIGEQIVSVECSFGAASSLSSGRDSRVLCHDADVALYEHKRGDRDRREALPA